MSKVKVYAPNTAYRGDVGGAVFVDGVAEVEHDHPSMSYFKRRGYGIGKAGGEAIAENPVLPYDKLEPTGPDGEIVDARDYGEAQRFGAPLRDAAVDPHPDDFLPPTNAGEANPHGPKVVAPEIHASGPAGIRAGEVFVDDTDRQAAEETALATATLVEGVPVPEATTEPVEDETDRGPLGLSDPGSADMGRRDATETVSLAERRHPAITEAPAKSAKVADWRVWAVSQGMDADEAEAASKGDLIARYGG